MMPSDERDVRVSSWRELNEQLFAGSWQEYLGRFRSAWVFRGMTDAGYDLSTSLARRGGQVSAQLEQSMLRSFRRYAYRPDLGQSPIWNWLALAQHHGLSTRLLDWTYSPLVAAHYTTENSRRFDVDGVIWTVDHIALNRLLPGRLHDLLTEEGTDVFTADMLDRVAHSLGEYDSLADDTFVAFFEPPSLDDRIVNQYALFSLPSDPTLALDCWLAEHPELFRRIIIPADLKAEVRDKLDQINISERVLYPGLDGICAWINRYYTPRSDVQHSETLRGDEMAGPESPKQEDPRKGER